MAPTPVSVNGILRLIYEVAGLEHRFDSYVTIVDPGGTNQVEQNLPLGGSDSPVVVAQAIWDYIRVLWPNTVPAATYILYEYDAGTLIPRDGGALTGAGVGATAIQFATQFTITYRDQNQYMARQQFAETIIAVPSKQPASGATGNVLALIDAMTGVPDGVLPCSWVRARTGMQFDRALFTSSDTNDKFRRARGA
jgi:hypothetical protein